MHVLPESEDFAECYGRGFSQVLWLTLAADLQTPTSVYLKLTKGCEHGGCEHGGCEHGGAMSYLLESVEGGNQRGRYSFIACRPDFIWKYEGGRVSVNRDALHDLDSFEVLEDAEAIASLQKALADMRLEIPDGLPSMACVLGGYLGYDCIRLIEDIADSNEDFMGLPDGIFMRPTLVAVFDNVTDSLHLVTPVFWDGSVSASEAYESGMQRLVEVRSLLAEPLADELSRHGEHQPLRIGCNISDESYMAMVDRAKEYIFAGDIFQVVLSRRYCIEPFEVSPFSLYRSLRRLNPSPYMFYLDFGSFQVVGSSPEILVQLSGDRVTIRPIAGTRKRGSSFAEDESLARELLSDEKECAEHLMLLDLGRNDCGRVSRVGSVEVTDSFFIERYSHVMHIVSNVEGVLSEDYDALSALLAGFPAGTVSGAPKVRAMEIIDELEEQKRGIYGGGIGHFSANGDMNSCIALRTAIVKDGCVYIQAGAGIVADSVAESESNECYQKAQAIFRAAEQACRYQHGNY